MGTKYIIEVEDKPFELLSENGFTSEKLFRVKGFNSLVFDWNGLNMLTPYTEPDMEQVRKEAYKEGREAGINDGMCDAWEAARKICLAESEGGFSSETVCYIFNTEYYRDALRDYTPAKAIEKIRQCEQEKDRQARIEYNFDEIKDVLETTANECNVSLDEIAEVLQKMKETDNG